MGGKQREGGGWMDGRRIGRRIGRRMMNVKM